MAGTAVRGTPAAPPASVGSATRRTRRAVVARTVGVAGIAGALALSACSQTPAGGGSAVPAGKLTAKLDVIIVPDPGEDPQHEKWVARFQALNPGVTINLTLAKGEFASDYVSKVLAMVAAGTPPDATYVHPADLAGMAAKGVLTPVDAFVQRDKSSQVEDIYPTTLDYYRYKGKLWGLPYYSGPSVTYFNKTLFDKLGAETPDKLEARKAWTWDALADTGKRLTAGEGDQKTFGYLGTTSSLHWFNVAIWSNGGDVWDEAINRMLVDQPAALAAIEQHTAMQTQLHIVPNADERKSINGGFNSGRIGMIYGIRANVSSFQDLPFQPGMTALPAGPKGRFCRNGPNALCLYTASKQQDAAWAYANWVSQAEAQKIAFDVKRSVPVRKSTANSTDFERTMYPWESAAVYREASDKVRAFPLPSTYNDVNKLFTTAYTNVLNGTQSVREAIGATLPQMNQLLAQKL
jgi:multiple sugar transport system substrate-binding protein